MNLSKIPVGEYPRSKSYVVSSFENSCKLAVILNDIILQLYSRRATADADEKLRGIRSRLDEWREKSPPHLRYDPDDLPLICPPAHILTQKYVFASILILLMVLTSYSLLYYTTVILLHRPFHSIPAHHAACRTASDNIEKLVLVFEKTYGFSRITYLMAYCVYTGASVMVQDVKKGDLEANIKMMTFLQLLRQGTTTCPVVQRSLDIITNGLRSDTTPAPQVGLDTAAADQTPWPRSYLPAFPYRGPGFDFGAGLTQGGMDLDGFSLLDCFPETQYDNTSSGGGWFFPAA